MSAVKYYVDFCKSILEEQKKIDRNRAKFSLKDARKVISKFENKYYDTPGETIWHRHGGYNDLNGELGLKSCLENNRFASKFNAKLRNSTTLYPNMVAGDTLIDIIEWNNKYLHMIDDINNIKEMAYRYVKGTDNENLKLYFDKISKIAFDEEFENILKKPITDLGYDICENFNFNKFIKVLNSIMEKADKVLAGADTSYEKRERLDEYVNQKVKEHADKIAATGIEGETREYKIDRNDFNGILDKSYSYEM